MELRIEPYSTPEQPIFNYEELKAELLQKAEHYASIVYTDEQIKDAKTDRANLKRLQKALNDERIRREKEYMEKFNVFKAQVNEIIGIIDKPVAVIDSQVKAFEENQRTIKFGDIEALWHKLLREDKIPAGVTFASLYNEKWLNASIKMPAIEKEIAERLALIEKDLAVLEKLPHFVFEAKEVYFTKLDLPEAVSESYRLQALAEKKAAWEAEQAKKKAEAANTEVNYGSSKPSEPIKEIPVEAIPIPEEPIKSWLSFKALLSVDDATALRNFFLERNIEFKSI